MKEIRISLLFLLFMVSPCLTGQQTPAEKGLAAINQDVLKAQLGFLSSDWMEGRETGQKGEFIAGDYIASMLKLYGVKPNGDFPYNRGFQNIQQPNERTWFQNFILIRSTPEGDPVMKLINSSGDSRTSAELTYNADFSVRYPGKGISIEAPVVFAGYGFKSDRLKYNDFSRIDVRGKFVMKISGVPAFARKELSPAELTTASREIESYLSSAGAAGIIEINANSSTVGSVPAGVPFDLSPSESNPRSGRPFSTYTLPGSPEPQSMTRITISRRAAERIFQGTGIEIDDYIKKAEANRNTVIPQIPGKSISFSQEMETTAVRTRNIVGIIEGETSDEVIVIGAHYDHLGIFGGYIWNGADDNGSGTVGVMTLAKAITESGKKPRKTIIIALWSAEEQGLLGSRYYVENLPYPMNNLKLNLNFDMISRYISEDARDKVIMTYTSSQPAFRTITEGNLKKYGIGLDVEFQASDDPPGGSDHRSFTAYKIPVMRFKPGHREEYHTPGDEVNTVDWDIMEKIVKISFANIWELANSNW